MNSLHPQTGGVAERMKNCRSKNLQMNSNWTLSIKGSKLSPQDQYNQDLIEGLFPDEDFTKLAKPWELQYEEGGWP